MIFAKKSLGQNFLVDKNVVKKIINLLKIKDNHIENRFRKHIK